jgi:hypothetical protein
MSKFRIGMLVMSLPLLLVAGEMMSNQDVVKLAKAGLSESFILSLIQERPSRFATDTASLIELKQQGVSESLVAAMVRKTPPAEALNTDSVIRLHRAGYSESFLMNLVETGQGRFAVGPDRIVEMKQAGISERLMSAMIGRSAARQLPAGTAITVRMIDEIDSQRAKVGDTFRASLSDAIVVNGETLAERGADATLRLVEERESGRLTGRAMLSVQLVSVRIGGRDVAVTTSEFSQESSSRTRETAVRTGVGSAIGATIGAIAGGGRGAAIGAGVGAGAGVGSQVFTRGERVRIPSETLLSFRTTAAATLP